MSRLDLLVLGQINRGAALRDAEAEIRRFMVENDCTRRNPQAFDWGALSVVCHLMRRARRHGVA